MILSRANQNVTYLCAQILPAEVSIDVHPSSGTPFLSSEKLWAKYGKTST